MNNQLPANYPRALRLAMHNLQSMINSDGIMVVLNALELLFETSNGVHCNELIDALVRYQDELAALNDPTDRR